MKSVSLESCCEDNLIGGNRRTDIPGTTPPELDPCRHHASHLWSSSNCLWFAVLWSPPGHRLPGPMWSYHFLWCLSKMSSPLGILTAAEQLLPLPLTQFLTRLLWSFPKRTFLTVLIPIASDVWLVYVFLRTRLQAWGLWRWSIPQRKELGPWCWMLSWGFMEGSTYRWEPTGTGLRLSLCLTQGKVCMSPSTLVLGRVSSVHYIPILGYLC